MISLRHLISTSPSSDVAYTFIKINPRLTEETTSGWWWCYAADTAPWPIFSPSLSPYTILPSRLPPCLSHSISNYLRNSFPVISLCLILSVRSSTCLSVLIRLPLLLLYVRLSPCICLYTCLSVSFCLLAILSTCLGPCLSCRSWDRDQASVSLFPYVCLYDGLSLYLPRCLSLNLLSSLLPLSWKQRKPEVMNKGNHNWKIK